MAKTVVSSLSSLHLNTKMTDFFRIVRHALITAENSHNLLKLHEPGQLGQSHSQIKSSSLRVAQTYSAGLTR